MNYCKHPINHCRYILTLALVMILLMLSTVAAGNKICDHCGKKVGRGGWIKFEGKYFHNKHFICDNCSGDLRDGLVYFENGQKYDSACYFELIVPKCAHCGRPIEGHFVEHDSSYYHKKCYEDNIGPRCALCGESIYGQYLTDLRGNTIHARHKDDYAVCGYCASPIASQTTGGGVKYDDDRHVCALCLKSAVNDIDEAREIMIGIIDELAGHGIAIDEKNIPLELIDHGKMRRKSGSSDDELSGYTYYERQSSQPGIWVVRDFKIFVLHGMPRPEFIFTTAHELMHVWLIKNGQSDMEPILTEGSCQYAGMLAISGFADEEANIIRRRARQNTSPTYGEGLRQVETYVNEAGVATWLEYLKNHTEPPW